MRRLVLLFALAAACGDDDGDDAPPTCEELGCTFAEACPATSFHPTCRCQDMACTATPPDGGTDAP